MSAPYDPWRPPAGPQGYGPPPGQGAASQAAGGAFPWLRWIGAIAVSTVGFLVAVVIATIMGPPLLDGLFGVYEVTGIEYEIRSRLLLAGMVMAMAWWLGGSPWLTYKLVRGRTDRELLAVASAPLAVGAVLLVLGTTVVTAMGLLWR